MKIKNAFLLTMAALCVLPFAPAAFAQNGSDTWLGNADNNWSTAANWSPAVNAPPIGGDWLFFGAAGSSGTTLTNGLANGLSFNGLTFNSGASAFTLIGNPIVLAGGITNNSTSAQVIGLAITNTTAGRPLITTPGGGNVTLNGGLYGTGGSFSISGGGTVSIGGTANTQTGTTTVTNSTLILMANNALPVAQLSLLGAAGQPSSSLDLNGYSQVLNGATALFGTDANNTTPTGCYVTNSSATLSVLTLTNYGNNFQFREGNIGGNLKLVLIANSLNGSASAAGNTFQAQVPNTYSGGTLISGVGTTPLSTTNLAAAGDFVTSGVGACTNTAAFRFQALSSGNPAGTGPITLDNGEIWITTANFFNPTNPVIVTSRGGILRSENNNLYWGGAFSGSGLLALCTSQTTFNFSNDLSGFTGTLAVNTGSGAGVATVNISSNSTSGDLLFWGNGSRTGVVQWNGPTASPVTLAFTRVNCSATLAVGRLSSGNASTVTYQLGDNSATTNNFGGVVQNGNGAVGVTKIGSDTQILSGANTYTNPTYVGGGTLVLSGVNSGAGGCVVSNGATLSLAGSGSLTSSTATVNVQTGGALAGGGSIGGLVSLDSGNAKISLLDGVSSTLTLANGLTLNNGNALSFDVGDVIAMTGGTYSYAPGTVTVNVSGSVPGAGTYPLISGASIVSTNGFVMGTRPSNLNYDYFLVASSGNLALSVVQTNFAPDVAYWKGGVDNNWNTPDSGGLFNWSTNSGGTLTTVYKPGVNTAVTFSAGGAANQNTVLGGNFEIKGLALTSAANVGIGGANALQLDNGGLTVNSGAGNLTISNTSLVIGGAQVWTNSSSDTVSVSAPISGSALTLGGGNTVFSGVNSHSGTAVAGGAKLTLSGSGTLGSGSATVIANGSTLDLGGTSQSVGAVSLLNNSAITNGTIIGTSYDLQSGTMSAVLGGNVVTAVKSTANTVILSANNTFSGTMIVSNGTLQIGAGGLSGSLSESFLVISNGASLVFNSSGSQTNSGNISGPGPVSILGGGSVRLTSTASTFSGNVTVDGSGSTLISGTGANTANATAGVLGNPSVQRTFFITNGATLALNGGNTFGGWSSTRCGVDLVLGPGSQLSLNANDSNPVGDVDLNAATISVGNGFSAVNQALTLMSNVVVEGTSPSYITVTGSDATRNGVHLGAYNTDAITDPLGGCIHFMVNSTGASADLTVSARLLDPSFSVTLGTGYLYTTYHGGLYKDGSGTMLLTAANNTYSGPTIINAGKLIVSSAQGASGMTNYVDVIDGSALGILVNGTNQWSPSLAYIGPGGGAVTLEFTGLNNTNFAPFNPAALYSTVGPVTVNVKGSLSVGKYPLVGNAAAYIGSFSIGALPFGAVASLVVDADTTTIDLDVTTGSKPYIWSGLNNTNWDTTTANNWQTNGIAAIYEDLVPVQFDDTATSTNVNVVGTLSPGSMVISNINKNYTFAGGAISGSASLTKNGNGILILGNTNSYVGGTVVNAGTLQLGDGASRNGVVSGNISDNGNLAFANSSDQTFVGVISGIGSLTKKGAGTLTLTASNTYSGATTLAAGAVLLPGGVTRPFGFGSLTLSNGTALIVQPNSSTSPVLLENSVLIPAGVSAFVDNSANTFGNFWAGSDTAQWTGSGTVRFQNNGANIWTAVLWSGNPFQNFQGTINIGSTNGTSGMLNGFGYGGYLTNYTQLATVDASSVTWKLGDVGFSRTFAVNLCTLVKLGSISATNPATEIRGNGTAACTYEIGALNASTTFAGFIYDGGAYPVSLKKVGSGTLTLTGTNSYTGNTVISAGTLELAQTFATLSTNSTININAGASLKLTLAGVTNVVSGLVTNGTAAGNGLYSSANSSGYITGSGYLRVGAVVGPTEPGNITSSINGNVLTLTWPAGQGWRLVSQTNSLLVGVTANGWSTVPGGIDGSNSITINPANPVVFYKLVYP